MDSMILKSGKRSIWMIFFILTAGQLFAKDDDKMDYVQYAKNIMNPFIERCEKEYHLDCIGTGGRFGKNVAGIDISFIAYRKGTMEEARTLEVKMIEQLRDELNAHEKIRPFLAEYPFKSKEINISVAFRKPDNSCYSDGSVVLVFQACDKLLYSAEDPKTGKLVDLLEESYEEALKKVLGQ